MSYSSLVNYKKISPNRTSPRRSKIDTITIHHMAGNLTVEQCGNVFASSSAQASSNYGIGSDGRIGLYVDESDRSWASSSPSNDHRAITIEVANDQLAPKWTISTKAYNSLIKLLVDICERNNIKKLLWKGDPNITDITKQNMTVHRWFAATACPGDYLYSKMGTIASDVNKLLGSSSNTSTPIKESTTPSKIFKEYKVKINANILNYRAGAGQNYTINGYVKKGEVYTIVNEQKDSSNNLWGKLKSGAGWICLKYTIKI